MLSLQTLFEWGITNKRSKAKRARMATSVTVERVDGIDEAE